MLTEREAASIGPRDLKKPGTVQWAWQTVSALKRSWEIKQLTAHQYQEIVAELKEHQAWKIIPPRKPYGSLDAMLKAEIGHTHDEAIVALRSGPGRPPKGEEKGSVRTFFRGENSRYLQARIARDRPDILERMKAGEFRSVRAAALEAGIVKEKTVTEKIRSLWTKLSDSEKRQLVKWISEQD